MTIGQKIRQLRKEKNITQSELAGEEITRNMLSRIESDKGLPSLSTLLFLAKRLDVSPGYLINENVSLFDDRKLLHIDHIKHAFAIHSYKEVLRTYEKNFTECDDELALILAESCFALANEAMHNGKMVSAEKYAQEGLGYCDKTVYPTHHLRASLCVIAATLKNIQSPKYDVAASAFPDLREDAVSEDFYRYISEKYDGHTFKDPIYAAHVAAKKMIAEGHYADALTALEAIEARKSERGFSVLVLFRIYSDLEICHKELRNFEAAYRYSAKKLSLLSAFRG